MSVPDVDVEFMDAYAASHGVGTWSAVVHRAIALLRSSELADDYEAAWDEWAAGDGDLWEVTTADGLHDPAET